jgi:dolichyl-phosphate-mannose--protein O-mannosyl transferase
VPRELPRTPYDAAVTITHQGTQEGRSMPGDRSDAVADLPAEAAPPLTMRDRLTTPMPTDRLWGWIGPIAVTVLAGVLRFANLGNPPKMVFDETYYAKDAYSVLKFGYARAVVTVPSGDPPIDSQILDGRTDIFSTDPSYVVHPPVGKWMIAFGEWIFGLTPFGWRFSVALFGTLSVLLLSRIARRLFRSTLLGTIAGLLLALEGLSIVMSRTALLDGLLTFWVIAGFGFLIIDRDWGRERLADRVEAALTEGKQRPGGPRVGFRWWRLAAGICFGLALGTKWSALYVIAACGLLVLCWDITARRRAGIRRPFSAGIIYDGIPAFGTLVATSVVTYCVTWTGWFLAKDSCYRTWATTSSDRCTTAYAGPKGGPTDGLGRFVPDPIRSWWHYHAQMYGFHTGLTADHPYKAAAWKWLYLGRPTQFDFTQFTATTSDIPEGVGSRTPEQLCGSSKCAQDVVGVGTPAIWWAGIAALIVLAVIAIARLDGRAGAILLVFASTYFPWFQYPERPIFFFYAVLIIPFMILAITYVIGLALGPPGRSRRRTWAGIGVGVYLLLVLMNTAYLYPVLTGEWIPYAAYSARMWFGAWI